MVPGGTLGLRAGRTQSSRASRGFQLSYSFERALQIVTVETEKQDARSLHYRR